MKIDENAIIDCDCSEGERKRQLHDRVCKLKPFHKYAKQNVPIEDLEKYVKAISNKYNVVPQWVFMDMFANKKAVIYSCSVMRKDNHEWLGTVYGSTLHELFSKLSVKMEIEAKKLKGKK